MSTSNSWVAYAASKASVVTVTELSPPPRWLATTEPTPPPRCLAVFYYVLGGVSGRCFLKTAPQYSAEQRAAMLI